MKYIRKKGFYARKSGNYLVVYQYSSGIPIVLHPSSVLIYSLIDGALEKQQIIDYVKQSISNGSAKIDEEIESSFQQLIEFGLIETSFASKQSHSFISVSFKGFWENFDQESNYFLDALTSFFIPVIVDPAIEIPSIIFIGDENNITGYNHDTQDSISIGVKTSKESKSNNSFDLNLFTFKDESSDGSLTVPLWAIHFPWINHMTNAAPDHHLFELMEFNPNHLGEKIYNFLDTYYKDENDNSYDFWVKPEAANIKPYTASQKGRLTIGMATYDDFDGPYFTMQSIRLYHPEVRDQIDFIIIDNNPGGPVGESLKKLEESIPNYKYLPFNEYKGTATRDLFFREAQTEYVMSIDSHVMINAGALEKLLDYLDARPDSKDLFQGPILYDDLKIDNYSSSFRPEWSEGMYGTWVKDEEAVNIDSAPFEIQMQGLGLFVCRKDAWLGFNARLRGFGGEEGYIHEKYRQAGRKTFCLPFLRWLHRFGRPNGTLYPNIWMDRVRNYYITFREVGWDTTPIDFHFTELLGKNTYAPIKSAVVKELNNPLHYFDAVYYLVPSSIDESTLMKIRNAGFENRLRLQEFHINEDETIDHDKTCEMIVDKSVKHGFKNVMVIQNKVNFSDELYNYLVKVTKNINEREWACLHIGSDIRGTYISIFDKNLYLPSINRPPNTHISAFNLEHVYNLYKETQVQEPIKLNILEESNP